MKSAIFVGQVEHRRFTPVKNEFTYSVLYYYIDLDEAQDLFRIPLLFAYNFPGLLSFWRKDYMGPLDLDLKSAVKRKIFEKTGKSFDGSVRLLTNISYFGYCFNPVSFYYCFDEREKLRFIVSQVTNTPWKERHEEVFEVSGDSSKHVFRFPKEFHVSPFMPMSIDYTWVFGAPGDELYVHMQNRNSGESRVMFDTTLELHKKKLSAVSILGHLLRFPFTTFKTIAAIYYQAAILYFVKRIPFYTHPKKIPAQKEKVS